MTTVASNPSGRKSVKDKKISPTKIVPPPAVTESINNQSEEFRNKSDKFQPTAEQMRIASLMSDKKDENDLKPKIEQIVELTGASRDDAAVALYDCDNDMTKAIEMILDGDTLDSEWQSTGRKKKTKASNSTQLPGEALTNGNKKSEKSSRSNVKNNLASSTSTAVAKGQRGGAAAPNRNRKKDNRPNDKNGSIEEDIFAKASNAVGDPAARRNGGANRRGGLRPRGASRGKGPGPGRGGSGSRTFMNRGLQNNDGFPNSIETWTNSTAEQAKPNDDLNTMTVGNWSDIAANEDWSEEDWTSAPMETKVFTPSTKVISEAGELTVDQSKSINNSQQNASQLSFIPPNKNEESTQPTMSAILSGNIKRVPVTVTAGQALLQQIQQQSSASQNSNLNQYTLSQYSKQATESIKSLVGLNSSNIISNEIITPTEDNLSSKQSPQASNQNRIKVPNRTSKIPESAVEMPSNDPISNLSVHFGSLEFGANNTFSLGANDSNLFDSVNQNKKPESKNISLLSSSTENSSTSNFRTSNVTTNKPILQGPVLPQRLNDSMLNSDHRGDKTSLNSNSYNTSKPQLDRKSNDYMNMNAYKSTYSANDNSYSAYQTSAAASNMSYYSNSNQATPFGNSGTVSQSLIGTNNAYSSTYNNSSMNHVNNNNTSNVPKLRDNESNSVQQQQVSASSTVTSKPYDTASSIGTSLSLMSNSTVTTNVLKNTLSASKGVHNVPPGVQPAQVLSTPYIMGNTPGLPMPYPPYAYDVQFQNPRDHGYSPYPAPDVKYNRGSESDMLPVSSQTAGAVQTATQAHNQAYMNTAYPPGYGFYFGVNFAHHQGLYSTPQHAALYPVAQAQTTAQSAGSAFAKANTAANYGSHSYNSGYDSLATAVAAAQTQDYVNKSYPQQLQQHKQLSGTNAGDLSGNNSQSIYNKTHSQINKNYDKQGFQTQAPQFNMSNTAQSAASLSSPYGGPYLLPHQQAMHHSLATAEPSQQPPGVGNQRNLSQTHKGSGSSSGAYAKFANWN